VAAAASVTAQWVVPVAGRRPERCARYTDALESHYVDALIVPRVVRRSRHSRVVLAGRCCGRHTTVSGPGRAGPDELGPDWSTVHGLFAVWVIANIADRYINTRGTLEGC